MSRFVLEWWWFLALWPVPWMLRRALPPRESQAQAVLVPTAWLGASAALRWRWSTVLGWVLWSVFILALARPQSLGAVEDLSRSGRDLVLAVDVSGSMQQQDFVMSNRRVTRLHAVKSVVSDFLRRRYGDRVGLILFGEQAFVQAPLTFDRETVAHFLRESAVGLAGQTTSLGDAIGLAIKRFVQDPEESSTKVLLLLTDGRNTSGQVAPRQAAQMAQRLGLRIYTIGVGGTSGLFSFGGSDLDEQMLRELADISGGRYFRADNTQELMEIYAVIDQLEPALVEQNPRRRRHDLYFWPLLWVLCGLPLWAWSQRRD